MIITDVNDYIDKIKANHPELTDKQLRYILRFGMIAFDSYLKKGFGIKLSSPNVTMWTGDVHSYDSEKIFEGKARKLRKKVRYKYVTENNVFDGYYYFCLSEDFFKKVKPLNKKAIKFKQLTIFKSYEECFATYTNCYIFKFYYPTDLGFKCILEDEMIRDFEFIGKKENGKLIKNQDVKRDKK